MDEQSKTETAGAEEPSEARARTHAPDRSAPSEEVLARRAEYPRLRAKLGSLAAAQAALDHQILLALRELDEGYAWEGWASCAHYLEHQLGWSAHEARERLRTARALKRLPQLGQALAKGELSYTKLRKVAPIADASNEGRVLNLARTTVYRQLAQVVAPFERALVHGGDAENAADPAAAAARREEARRLTLRQLAGGLSRVEATVLDEELEVIQKALDAQRLTAQRPEDEGGEGAARKDEGEADAQARRKTRRQQRVDGFVSVFEESLAAAAEGKASAPVFGRYEVLVHVTAADLQREVDRELAQEGDPSPRSLAGGSRLQSGARLSADAARRLACHGGRCDLLVEDLRLRTSEVLDVGRRQRGPSNALLRALWARDAGCRFPGCSATRFVDAHHVEHWADGGPTKLGNLILLCRSHHRLLHEGGYGVAAAEGSFVFRDPTGQRVGEEQPVFARSEAVERELATAAAAATPGGLRATGCHDDFEAPWAAAGLWDSMDFDAHLERQRERNAEERVDGWSERARAGRDPPAA